MAERTETDWKDFLALTIAVYQLVMPPLLLMLVLAFAALVVLRVLAG